MPKHPHDPVPPHRLPGMPSLSVSARSARTRATLSWLVVLATLTALSPLSLATAADATASPSTPSAPADVRVARHLDAATVVVATRVRPGGLRVVTRLRVDNLSGKTQPRTRAFLYLTQHGERVYRLGGLAVPGVDGLATARLRAVSAVGSKVAPGRYAVMACVDVVGRNSCASSRAAVVVGPAELSLTPAQGDAGIVLVDETSQAVRFVLSNSGTAGARRTRVAVDGTDRHQFVVLADACTGRTLTKGATCSVDVALRPTRPGGASARVVLTTNRGSAYADLSGTGRQPDAVPAALRITPATEAFPDTLVGTRSAPTTLTVTNTGGLPTGPPTASFAGSVPVQFTVTGSTCESALPPAGSCHLAVRFDPTGRGSSTADLSVTGSPGGTVTATLTGKGLAPAALQVTPEQQGFAATLVGEHSEPVDLTVTNTGDVTTGPLATTLSGADAEQFSPTGTTCGAVLAPAASCTISVIFEPTVRGPRTAQLDIGGTSGGTASVPLSGLALAPAALMISAAAGPFASTVTGGQSDAVVLSVTNVGDGAVGDLTTTLAGVDPDQFVRTATTCELTLAPGGTCTVSIAFAPTSRGTKSVDVEVSGSPGGLTATTLTGLALAAAEVRFATQPSFPDTTTLEHSGPLDYTLTNDGDVATGALTAVLTGDQAAEFTIAGTTCTTLAPAATCTVTVTFDPKLRGWTDRALRLASLAVAEGDSSPAVVGVYGYALPVPAKLVISPASWTFEATVAGGYSSTHRFVITNVGDLSTGLLRGGSFSGPNPGVFSRAVDGCYSHLGYGDTCWIDVRLAPPLSTVKGAKSASLDVSVTPGGTASAQLIGDTLTPAYPQASASKSFGGVLVGERSASITFTFTNTGDVATAPLATSITGFDPTQYAVDQDGCTGVTLAPTESCSVSTYFAPTSRGSKRASIGVASYAIPATMLGTGLAPTNLVLTPVTATFATTAVGQVSATLDVTVTNTGDVTSGVVTTALGGTDADQFTQTASTCGVALAVNRTCKVTYRFAPTSTGAKSASVSASGGPAANTATLNGTAG